MPINQNGRPFMLGSRFHTVKALFFCCLIWTAFSSAMAGCKEENPASTRLKQKIPQAKQTAMPDTNASAIKGQGSASQKPRLLPLETPKSAVPMDQTSPRSKRDPFESFIEIKTEASSARRPAKVLTPLQRYSLDQLKVVGILEGDHLRKALIEDDVGKGFVVSRGEAIGNQDGTIVAVKPDRIVIEEAYQDALGNRKVRRITKKLYSAE